MIFVAWLYAANLMYTQIMGSEPASVSDFVHEVTSTSKGTDLIVYGNLVGLMFALVVLVISVVSSAPPFEHRFAHPSKIQGLSHYGD